MKRLLYAIAALLLVALGALLLAPSTLIDGWLRERTGGRLAMTHSEGTLWRGAGELSVTLPAGRTVVLPGVRWRISPWSVLGGALEGSISAGSGAREPLTGTFRVERNSTEVRDLAVTLPANALAVWAMVANLAPSGQVSIEIESLRWAPPGSAGGGRIRWREASLQLPDDRTRFALGTVDLQFVARGDHLTHALRNDGGDVSLEGSGTWRPGAAPSLDATLRARAGTPESLVLALSRMGGAPGGAVRLRLPGAEPAAR